jgi:hypothetical protein
MENDSRPPALREGLPPLPEHMQSLPVDARGYPVPYFVAWIDGKPDFRVIAPGRIGECHNRKLCWLCGQPVGRYLAFVIGPMCAINRVSSEPPSHRDCAEFAVRACPFLVLPKSKRRDANLPDETTEAAGIHLPRNPGVAMVWITRAYQPFRTADEVGRPGVLFRIGDPVEVLWFAEGRTATRAEIMASIDSGFPRLQELADEQGAPAQRALREQYDRAMTLIPAEA